MGTHRHPTGARARRLHPSVRRAAPWGAGAALVAGTVAVGVAIAPTGPTTEPATPVADAIPGLPTDPEIQLDQIQARLGEQAASRAARESAEVHAQEVQDAADASAVAAQEAAASASASKAAAQEAAAEASRKSQEAAATPTPTSDTPSISDEAPAASRADGVIVPGARITSLFEMRWGVMHWGIDLAAPLGTPIYTPIAGTVLKAGPASGFGNAIYIQDDATGDVLVLGHMRTMYVSAGEHVSAGDRVALVGSEGQSTGPHCHVEWHLGGINGTKVNPANYLDI